MNEPHRPLLNRPALLISLAAVAALIGGILAASLLFAPKAIAPETVKATYLPGGKPLTEFQLIDHTSQQFDNSSLKGRWTFVFFGYTFCPDICPTTLATMAAVEAQLRNSNPKLPIQSVFVSVDPKRDTPARLAQYVPYFGPHLLGVSGTEQELVRFARSLGSVFQAHAPQPGQTAYLVDHSSAVLLINPAGQLQAVFSAPHDPAAIVQDFQSIHEFYRAE